MINFFDVFFIFLRNSIDKAKKIPYNERTFYTGKGEHYELRKDTDL